MSTHTTATIERATRGRWLLEPADRNTAVTGFSTDTRALEPGQAFLALQGEYFDGHAFITEAADHGASIVIIDSPDALNDAARSACVRRDTSVLLVKDVPKALHDLAAAHRARLTETTVLAVTGSVGKTTVVRMLDAALGAGMPGIASIKSFNNRIGVPLTILSAQPEHRYLICEVGMSMPGEIEPLVRLIRPHGAVITAIGRSHIESLGTVEAIAREKATVLMHLEPGGFAVAPDSSSPNGHYLDPFLATVPAVIRVGRSDAADCRIEHAEPINHGLGLAVTLAGGGRFEAPVIGLHHATNIASVVALARHLGMEEGAIGRGLAAMKPPDMRLSLERIGEATVLNDAYNASPESMVAAIAAFSSLAEGAPRRVMLLGDMLELGEHAEAAHLEVGRAIAENATPDLLVAVGRHAPLIADVVCELHPGVEVRIYSELTDDHAARIAGDLRPGDHVLLKGSRSMGLERIASALRARLSAEAAAG